MEQQDKVQGYMNTGQGYIDKGQGHIDNVEAQMEKVPLLGGKQDSGRTQLEAFFGLFLPPVQVYQRTKKFDKEFFICQLLSFCMLLPGSLYAFSLEKIPLTNNLLCVFMPPVGLYLGTKKVDLNLLICVLLLITWLGSSWWAYAKHP